MLFKYSLIQYILRALTQAFIRSNYSLPTIHLNHFSLATLLKNTTHCFICFIKVKNTTHCFNKVKNTTHCSLLR